MIAWAGRCLRLAVRTVIPAVKMAHHEQVSMWECILLTSAAAPLTAVGPLRWVPSTEVYCTGAGTSLVTGEQDGVSRVVRCRS
jgi:hypothetical protein